MKIVLESKHLAPFLSLSFIALENFVIAKYKGKPSYVDEFLNEANTQQAAAEEDKSKSIVFNNIEEVGSVQKFSKEALFNDHYDFRLKYFFGSLDNHLTKTMNILLPFLFMNSIYAPILTMRICETYFFSRGISYLYENYQLKNKIEGDGTAVKINKIIYIVASGLISVSLLKSMFFPAKSWASHMVEKAREVKSKEVQVVENIDKTLRQ